MVKNKSRLAIKLFIIVWIVLAIHIALKLTFNYWQPYIIPNEQLQVISDFIDANRWIQATLNGILFLLNSILILLSGLRKWWFKNKKQIITTILLYIILFVLNVTLKLNDITIIIGCFIYPLIINKKRWLSILLTFIFNFIFLFLSLWLEDFTTANEMPYIIAMLLNFYYYIMLVLNYFVFNLSRKEDI